MKKRFKKLGAFLIVMSLMLSISVSVFAQEPSKSLAELQASAKWENAFKELMARGLTMENIKSLTNQGLTPDEQTMLTNEQLYNYLKGTYGKSITAPSGRASTVTVTNIPDDYYGITTEIFLSGCGMYNGDFYANNSGSTIVNTITQFSNFTLNSAAAYKFYFLYGEYDASIGYHKGVDIKAKNGLPQIRSANAGTARRRSDYGGICVQDGNYTYSYLHMTNIIAEGAGVNVGTVLGTEGAVGASGAHLHFEVRQGNTTSLGDNSSTNRNVSPYYHMAKSL